MLFVLLKKKNWKPVTCIALLLVIGIVGAGIGQIFGFTMWLV